MNFFSFLWAPRLRRLALLAGLLGYVGFYGGGPVAAASAPEYAAVHQLFAKHCLDCHSSHEPEGKLILESFELVMKGGESGPVVIPGKSSDSLVLKLVEGSTEREGKRRIMPPGKRAKLDADEIAMIRRWIDAGAPAPAEGSLVAQELVTPKILPKGTPRRPIHGIAFATAPKLVAVARYGEVELYSAESRSLVRTLRGHKGTVNAVTFSPDSEFLFAAGGEAGRVGEVRQWKVADATLVRIFSGHKDALYAVAISWDGKVLASGSYDQKIILWDVQAGTELRTLSGHNGAIFDLAFRPDDRILASASADRTVKLWDPVTGERRDTLSQSLKELNSVAFSPDGKRLYAAGVDNRIRVWEISDKALETTNPLLESRFAHEGAILRMAFSPDGQWLLSSASDQTLKLWHARELTEKRAFERQSDWVSGLAFLGDDKKVVVGRLDGTLQFYDAETGNSLPPAKPVLTRVEPRGVQRGTSAMVKLIGTNLTGMTEVRVSDPRLKARLAGKGEPKPDEVWVQLESPADLARGPYELSLRGSDGETGKVKLQIDDLPQHYVARAGVRTVSHTLTNWPSGVWAVHEKAGDTEEYVFEAGADTALVFQIVARALGSKSDIVLTLMDARGRVLTSRSGVGARDPWLFYRFAAEGTYRLRVNELVLAGSPDHFYQLTVGDFPLVTGTFPLAVPLGEETPIQLLGQNLPVESTVPIRATEAGEVNVPLDKEKFRSSREFKLLVSERREIREVEPNDRPEEATVVIPPLGIAGTLSAASDADLYKFSAGAGDRWVLETQAAQRGSLADTKIEVLHPDGRPVEQLRLQAVRDSAVTFRGIDSETTDCRVVNWEEMQLNQYLYLQGEVVKLLRAPQGPDSGFLFYSSNGKRRCYFGSSPAAHAVDELCYIVEPRSAGVKPASNGLPLFRVNFANDDDSERRLGADSKLIFQAPADGEYLVRVSDTRRLGGDGFVYRLLVRPAEPDFQVTLKGTNLVVNAGSGQSFAIEADRLDDFEGEISVSINHLPPGFSVSTPLIIQAGHNEARGTLYVAPNAVKPSAAEWAQVEVTASASVEGKGYVKAMNNFGLVQLAEPPKLLVYLEPAPHDAMPVSNSPARDSTTARPRQDALPELTIAPGQTIPAWLRVVRNGHDDLITFTVENLPHGVIVDNIGLNGVLIPKGQDERQIFLTAANWVPDTDRWCFAVEGQAGRQTSSPVLLKVRRGAALQAGVAPR